MIQLLKFLPMLPLILILVQRAVQIVEEAKDGLSPAEARSAAEFVFRQLLQPFGVVLPSFIETRIPAIIDAIVAILNAVGVFQTGTPAATDGTANPQ